LISSPYGAPRIIPVPFSPKARSKKVLDQSAYLLVLLLDHLEEQAERLMDRRYVFIRSEGFEKRGRESAPGGEELLDEALTILRCPDQHHPPVLG
jgi:hypothetical protein